MDLRQKIRTLPASPGVYLYKNAEGEVIYVGKAKSLRARVRSYFADDQLADAKTGSLLREAVDLEYIVVDNDREALALENNLIKQKKPRFNILLRDDKTYPYLKLTLGERYPRIYVTRRLRRDGSAYYGPYFPTALAYKTADLVHRRFLVPSCTVDLERSHPRPCLQYYIKRCLGPCVAGLTTPAAYGEAVHDVKALLEGRHSDLAKSLRARLDAASENQQYELAAKYRDLISTVHDLEDRQRMAAVGGDDADVFGYHYENHMLAVNLFHRRGGRVLDRRELFWEDLPEFAFTVRERVAPARVAPAAPAGEAAHERVAPAAPAGEAARERVAPAAPAGEAAHERVAPAAPAGEASALKGRGFSRAGDALKNEGALAPEAFDPAIFFSALLKQVYIDQQYVPRSIFVPVDFEDRLALEELLSEKRGTRVEILVPQRGEKRSLIDLAGKNARQSYEQRFRVLKPQLRQVQEALQEELGLPELPRRIECFDISHLQGAETVASMVVWEDGKMKKSDYRKFIIRGVAGGDDFASMREVVTRRYQRVLEEKGKLPSVVLIDGGVGQLHSAAAALESLAIVNQPLAAIAKREEIIYIAGRESDPLVLDHHSPVLHLVQTIRDEAHRFAVSFHRRRRAMRDRSSELLAIPGVGERTRQRLLAHFGSLRAVQQADAAALTAVVNKAQAEAILRHFGKATV